mgnify:CR=1 FL=1
MSALPAALRRDAADMLPPTVDNVYRHFKGHEYRVLAIAKDADTLSKHVIYQRSDPDDKMEGNLVWSRSVDSWTRTIANCGYENVERFTYVHEDPKFQKVRAKYLAQEILNNVHHEEESIELAQIVGKWV